MKISALPNGRYALTPPSYSPATREACRHIPGLEWNVAAKRAEGYSDAIVIGARWLHEVRKLHVIDVSSVATPSPRAARLPRHPTAPPLRDYQSLGVGFLLAVSASGVLLADDMGLGKTATTITALGVLGGRTLIVCPSYVRDVWASELSKWGGGVPYLPEGVKHAAGGIVPDENNIVAIHYDVLHAWESTLAGWGFQNIVFDECHYLTGHDSRRSQVAMRLSHSARHRIGLSGTPLTNRPRDLWNVVNTLSPRRFGADFFSYGRRYCDGQKVQIVARDGTVAKEVWQFDGASRKEELAERLSHFMLRRTKQEVALQLPPKTRQVIRLQIKSRAPVSAPNKREMRALLDAACDAKLDKSLAVIRDHLAQGAKVVAFCWRRGVADWLATELAKDFPTFAMHGGVPQTRRTRAIHDARATVGAHLLTATIDSSATGIDLSYATVGVFVELTHEPHELLQCEARLHRFGAVAPTLIQYIIGLGTADEIVLRHVVEKLDVFEGIIGPTGEKMQGDFKVKAEEIMAEFYAGLGFK